MEATRLIILLHSLIKLIMACSSVSYHSRECQWSIIIHKERDCGTHFQLISACINIITVTVELSTLNAFIFLIIGFINNFYCLRGVLFWMHFVFLILTYVKCTEMLIIGFTTLCKLLQAARRRDIYFVFRGNFSPFGDIITTAPKLDCFPSTWQLCVWLHPI